MKQSAQMGDRMLETTTSNAQDRELEFGKLGFVRLSHQDVQTSLRQINGRLTREFFNSPDTLRVVDLEDAPVPINTRRFCELMAPYLCMN
jgi:hypothetical protein